MAAGSHHICLHLPVVHWHILIVHCCCRQQQPNWLCSSCTIAVLLIASFLSPKVLATHLQGPLCSGTWPGGQQAGGVSQTGRR